jgi:hypothetical protein
MEKKRKKKETDVKLMALAIAKAMADQSDGMDIEPAKEKKPATVALEIRRTEGRHTQTKMLSAKKRDSSKSRTIPLSMANNY